MSLGDVFNASDFIMRAHCGQWGEPWRSLYVGANIAIFLSYAAIAAELSFVAWKGLTYKLSELSSECWLFAAFISFCGIGHLLDGAGSFIWPAYRFFAIWHAVTALVSITTSWVVLLRCVRIVQKGHKKE